MDHITRTIYKCWISLLQHKIEKTHKKFTTPVSSPVSVSPNKYASLVVEDVDTQYTMNCMNTIVSFVSPSASTTVLSMGVPRSGLASDIKRGVLDFRVLINA